MSSPAKYRLWAPEESVPLQVFPEIFKVFQYFKHAYGKLSERSRHDALESTGEVIGILADYLEGQGEEVGAELLRRLRAEGMAEDPEFPLGDDEPLVEEVMREELFTYLEIKPGGPSDSPIIL